MSDNDKYKIPLVKDNGDSTLLYFWSDEKQGYETDGLDLRRSSDWQHWQAFLADHKSFRYESGAGSFSAVLEQRRKASGIKYYWYAHRRLKSKKNTYSLKRKYLGVSRKLDHKKLYRAAFALSQLELNLAD